MSETNAPECWAISDGTAGNERQATALAAALGVRARVVRIRVRQPWDALAPHLARILAPDGLLVYQTAARTEPAIEDLQVRTSRKYGSARLTLFEH